MSIKHTPGPWTVNPYCNDGAEVRSLAIVARCGAALTHSASDSQSIDAAEARANARLIAAAPDLLAALERLFRWGSWPSEEHKQDMESARAAIAKATKEKP